VSHFETSHNGNNISNEIHLLNFLIRVKTGSTTLRTRRRRRRRGTFLSPDIRYGNARNNSK